MDNHVNIINVFFFPFVFRSWIRQKGSRRRPDCMGKTKLSMISQVSWRATCRRFQKGTGTSSRRTALIWFSPTRMITNQPTPLCQPLKPHSSSLFNGAPSKCFGRAYHSRLGWQILSGRCHMHRGKILPMSLHPPLLS